MSWTAEQIATLTELWCDGLSAREIAGLLGVSKNAVIGKANRLGLSARRKPTLKYNEKPVSLYRCQYPFGHVGDPDFHFCGKPVDRNKSYCDEHHELCYQKGTGQTPHKAYGPNIGHSFQVGRTTKDDVKDITEK